jgi:hypothetical protein
LHSKKSDSRTVFPIILNVKNNFAFPGHRGTPQPSSLGTAQSPTFKIKELK